MQTTLAIDDDILSAVQEMANASHKSVGEIISDLARKALHSVDPERTVRNGILLLPVQPTGSPVTTELVRQLEEDLP